MPVSDQVPRASAPRAPTDDGAQPRERCPACGRAVLRVRIEANANDPGGELLLDASAPVFEFYRGSRRWFRAGWAAVDHASTCKGRPTP